MSMVAAYFMALVSLMMGMVIADFSGKGGEKK